MNIAIATHYFYPHMGGIENVAAEHARRLAERGHDVVVLSSAVDAAVGAEHRDGYRVLRYRAINPLERLGLPYPIPNPVSFRRLYLAAFTDKMPDVLHVHGLNYPSSVLSIALARDDIPIVLHQHTPFIEYTFPWWLIEYVNDATIGKWNLAHTDRVLCVSRDIQNYVKQLNTDAVTELMLNGVNIDRFRPDAYTKSDQFDIATKKPLFFFLSRLSYKKGVDVLLDAARRLENADVDLNIVIAGDGPQADEVAAVAAELDCMEMSGFIPDEALPAYYAAADAFLFTSRTGEAFPTLTMMEAFAAGTPVIASELDTNAPGLSQGKNTLLVPPDDSEQLAAAIRELAETPERARRMGAAARDTAERHFDIEDRIARLESMYTTIA